MTWQLGFYMELIGLYLIIEPEFVAKKLTCIFYKKFMQICNFHPNWLKFDIMHLYMILQKSGVGIFHILIFCPTFGP